ncbi:hypothetical protein HME9302_00012 [Alteripontixanthobacter maritimus]|uniref:Uncharacterized protein n=2 Tax=Alteripontixanthobacter maritimus TaxID=2161824 RepID=A0A369QNU6_9SPHN|nr:hypothetical protein HME9302_00012 [Alteripontixanthobacter maritimus]
MPVVYSGGGPVESIEPRIDFASIGGYYSGFLHTDTQLGTVPEADALVPEFGAAPGWNASSKLSGHAAIGWNLKFDKDGKVFAGGVPLLAAEGKWVKVYDPRKDDTQPGGVGAHRLGTEATYEWSENPALHAGTYAYGRYQNGKRTFGMAFLPMALTGPLSRLGRMSAMRTDGRFLASFTNRAIAGLTLRTFALRAVRSRWSAGKLSFRYSAPVVALDTITVNDLTEDRQDVTGMQSFRDRLNTVVPKYRSPLHDWELIDASPVAVSTLLPRMARKSAKSGRLTS